MNFTICLTTVFATLLSAPSSFAKPLIPLSPAEIDLRAKDLVQIPWAGKATNKGTTVDSGCLMATYTIQVDDPKMQTTKSYDLLVQAPQGAKTQVPVVVIVPTIDGTREMLEPVVARDLCNEGIATIIADVNDMTPPVTYPAWGAEDLHNRQAMLALRSVVDFAETVPRFDKNKIGALGLSMGGITTAMFIGVEPRLKAAVIIVGGGNFPHILSMSDEGHVDDLRRSRMKSAGLTTIDQYEDQLRSSVTYDPFYFAPQAPRERIMMVMAEADVKVPYVDQREQFVAFRKPESLTFTGGHVATIIEMVYLYMGDVTGFLKKRFDAPLVNSMTAPPVRHKVVDLNKLGI